MKIKNYLIGLCLAVTTVSAPVCAQDKTPENGNGDRDINVVRCFQHAQTNQQFELCEWLVMVADGQPTEWLEYYGMGWR